MAASITGMSPLVQPEDLRHLLIPLEVSTEPESLAGASSSNTSHCFGAAASRAVDGCCARGAARTARPGQGLLAQPSAVPGFPCPCCWIWHTWLVFVLLSTSSSHTLLTPVSVATNSSKLVPDSFRGFDLISEITALSQNWRSVITKVSVLPWHSSTPKSSRDHAAPVTQGWQSRSS